MLSKSSILNEGGSTNVLKVHEIILAFNFIQENPQKNYVSLWGQPTTRFEDQITLKPFLDLRTSIWMLLQERLLEFGK